MEGCDAKVIDFSKLQMGKPAAAILFIPLLGVVFYLLSNSDWQMNSFTITFAVDSLEIIAPIGSRTVVNYRTELGKSQLRQ